MWVIFLESFKVSDAVPGSCAGTLKRLACSLLKDGRRHGCAQKRLRSDRDALIVWRRGKVTDEANPHAARPLSLERSRRAPLSSKFLQSAFFLQTDRVPFGVRGKRGRDGGGAGLSRGCAHRGLGAPPRTSALQRPARGHNRSLKILSLRDAPGFFRPPPAVPGRGAPRFARWSRGNGKLGRFKTELRPSRPLSSATLR